MEQEFVVELSRETAPDAQDLLTEIQAAGVVLDYVPISQVAHASTEVVHRQALYVAASSASERRSVRPPSAPPPLSWSKRLSSSEFFGPAFDRRRNRLLMPASADVRRVVLERGVPDGTVAGPYTWTDADDPAHVVWFRDHSAPSTGYAFFFTQPPHGLQIPHLDVQQLFAKVNDILLGNPSHDSEIFGWNVDSEWAEYFADGEDWWGVGAWTRRLTGDALIVVLASATD